MGSPRQQRPAFNRRPVRTSLPSIVGILTPRLTLVAEHFIVLEFFQVPPEPTSVGSAVPIVLQGVPKVRRLDTGALPISCELEADGAQLIVTYGGAALTETEIFGLGAYDPAIRTATGAFSAGFILSKETQGPSYLDWTAAVTDGTHITVTFAGSAPEIRQLVNGWGDWQIPEVGALNVSAVFSEAGAILEFASGATPGNTLKYLGPTLFDYGSGFRAAKIQTVTLT